MSEPKGILRPNVWRLVENKLQVDSFRMHAYLVENKRLEVRKGKLHVGLHNVKSVGSGQATLCKISDRMGCH